MNHPLPGDYIDIHTHGSVVISGIYAIENLMAHEDRRRIACASVVIRNLAGI